MLFYGNQVIYSFVAPGRAGGGGALECNLTGRCPFLKSLHNPFKKINCILIPWFRNF